MAVQQVAYTRAMIEKAERLAAMVPTLARNRCKKTGIEYVVIPSSDDPEHTGHATNGLTCSCEGYDRRGYCSHELAYNRWLQRHTAERIAAAQQKRRENGTCKQPACIMTALRPGGRCDAHSRAIIEQLGV